MTNEPIAVKEGNMARQDIIKASKPEVTRIGKLAELFQKIQIAIAKGSEADVWALAEKGYRIATFGH